MALRALARVIASVPTSDGAGVRLRRSLGATPQARLDPFLLFDEFGSDDPRDYLAGFPAHPHRGFEAVTYMLEGRMRHEDSAGHRGDLGPGDVQWMTAGRGIVHSEMPQQSDGRLRGFQLWLNLPAAEKMKPAAWRDIPARDIPALEPAPGVCVRLIAGRLGETRGPVAGGATDPYYLDLELAAGASFAVPLPATHNAFVYAFEGDAEVGEAGGRTALARHAAGVLGAGDAVALRAGRAGARVLVLAARPIGEPVVQYGPFVMNTRDEIEQAIADYRAGRLGGSQARDAAAP
ncbi:MAG: pirin family protein [Burkholderiales bacterium]|nr:pirin family protein [Burkholderiales bacterium]